MARLGREVVVAVKFGEGWAATGALHGAWRAAGAARGIPAALIIAGKDRRPTAAIRGIWRTAFPGVPVPNPTQAMFTEDGKPSDALIESFSGIA